MYKCFVALVAVHVMGLWVDKGGVLADGTWGRYLFTFSGSINLFPSPFFFQ